MDAHRIDEIARRHRIALLLEFGSTVTGRPADAPAAGHPVIDAELVARKALLIARDLSDV